MTHSASMSLIEMDFQEQNVSNLNMRFFYIIIILIGSIPAIAQNKGLTNAQIGVKISDCISKNYKPDSNVLKGTCRRACIFIKFSIDENEDLVASFSKDSSTFIKEGLTKAIAFLNQDHQLLLTLKRSRKTVIQPFMYDYQYGCNLNKNAPLPNTREEGFKDLAKYYETRDKAEYYGETIYNMLNFDGKKSTSIECILLEPIRVSAGYLE